MTGRDEPVLFYGSEREIDKARFTIRIEWLALPGAVPAPSIYATPAVVGRRKAVRYDSVVRRASEAVKSESKP